MAVFVVCLRKLYRCQPITLFKLLQNKNSEKTGGMATLQIQMHWLLVMLVFVNTQPFPHPLPKARVIQL